MALLNVCYVVWKLDDETDMVQENELLLWRKVCGRLTAMMCPDHSTGPSEIEDCLLPSPLLHWYSTYI